MSTYDFKHGVWTLETAVTSKTGLYLGERYKLRVYPLKIDSKAKKSPCKVLKEIYLSSSKILGIFLLKTAKIYFYI